MCVCLVGGYSCLSSHCVAYSLCEAITNVTFTETACTGSNSTVINVQFTFSLIKFRLTFMQEVIENYDLSACTCTYVAFIKQWDSD